MENTQTLSGLESIIEKARQLASIVLPALKNPEDDVKYLESLVLKQDARFEGYAETKELKDYLSGIANHHRTMIYANKIAETLDRVGIVLVGEEIAEIPLKGLLYLAQIYHLAADRSLKVGYGRMGVMGAKYAIFETLSLIPVAGEIFDLTNVYYKEYMKSIASGIRFEDFGRRHALGKL